MKTQVKLVGLLLVFTVTTVCLVGIFPSSLYRYAHAGRAPPRVDRSMKTRAYTYGLPGYFSRKSHADIQLPSFWLRMSGTITDSTRTSGAILTAEPAVVENGGQVLVSWKNVPNPGERKPYYDWIGLYCPADAPSHKYLDYWFANESQTYSLGYGKVDFTLYNMRMDCEFRYFGNDTYTELMAISKRVQFVSGKEAPLHGHLALTGVPTQMQVHWTTGTKTVPLVRYGNDPSNLSLTTTGASRTYNYSDLCGPPANRSFNFIHPGYLHTVVLTGLKPNTKYYYQYGSGEVFSPVKSFTTALEGGDSTPYSFIVYGDMDQTPGAVATASLVKEEVEKGVSFVFHAGDLSYAVGYAFRWDIWMTLIEPYASLAPYMINIGNHDQDHLVGGAKDPSHAPGEGFHPPWGNFGDDSGGECGVPSYYRFQMPNNGNGIWWYSYDYGLAHFTVFSTEHDFTPGSRQYQWLLQDLKSVDRKITPWLIMLGHRPMYSSEKFPSEYRVITEMQSALEDMLLEYQVDVALWGHNHAYERTCAVYKQKCDLRGTVHIVVGTAGCWLDHVGTYDAPWSVHFEASYGYGRVKVANSSALLWEFIRDRDRTVADSVWIIKNH